MMPAVACRIMRRRWRPAVRAPTALRGWCRGTLRNSAGKALRHPPCPAPAWYWPCLQARLQTTHAVS
ncbi:hypothetical protein AL035_20325 [Salipiger aestuarii]|nr:hypothetical protein AL035_20325 [Salipiger aestuarii]